MSFKKGDFVICIDDSGNMEGILEKGKMYTISNTSLYNDTNCSVKEISSTYVPRMERFIKIESTVLDAIYGVEDE